MQFFIPGLPEKKRNNRRKADEIKRLFKCPANGCNKSYGYESTLRHHIKIKHQGIEPVGKFNHEGEKTVPDPQMENESDDGASIDNEPQSPLEPRKMTDLEANDKKVYKRVPTVETKCDEDETEGAAASNRALIADI